jgi:CBS domain containing-hemolysin-like protein
LFFFLGVMAISAAADMALASLSRVHLRQIAGKNNSGLQAADTLLDDPHKSLSVLVLLQTLGLAGVAGVVVLTIGATLPTWRHLVVLVLPAFLAVLFAQAIPRVIAARRPEAVALLLARPISRVGTLLMPLALPLSLAIGLVGRRLAESSDDGNTSAEDNLRLLVSVRDENGITEDEEKEMIVSIFELGVTMAREVMVPRIDMVAVDVETPLMDALDVILARGHSRIPVYEGTIDNILGLLYAKDLLRYLRNGETTINLRDILRPAFFIPESKKVDDLLQELQQQKIHMASVIDEYGGTAGLVTIEDLLEEIVGEIQDEYDSEESFVEVISDTEVVFNARVDLDDVNRMMDIELPTEESDTLGGLVYSQLGKVPDPGDVVMLDGVKIAVISVVGRRIKKVRGTKENTVENGGDARSG